MRRGPDGQNVYRGEYDFTNKWRLRTEYFSGTDTTEIAVRYRIHEFLSAEYVYSNDKPYFRIVGAGIFIMMQQLRNPKNVKMISLFVAAIFVLSCFAVTLQQGAFTSIASAAASESAIGVVNYQMLLAQSPDIAGVQDAMKQEVAAQQKNFDEKSKDMNDTEKQRYYQQLQEVIANKEKELMEPVFQKIEAAIKKVADKKGLAVVVEKNTVVYGGLDITDEVAKTLQSGK